MKLYSLLRFVFSADFDFIKSATGVSARRTSRFLVCNVFLLLKRRTAWREASGKIILTLVIGSRTLANYLFLFKFKRSDTQIKKKISTYTKNECFNMKYLKLMAKCFKKAFNLSSNCFSLY